MLQWLRRELTVLLKKYSGEGGTDSPGSRGPCHSPSEPQTRRRAGGVLNNSSARLHLERRFVNLEGSFGEGGREVTRDCKNHHAEAKKHRSCSPGLSP